MLVGARELDFIDLVAGVDHGSGHPKQILLERLRITFREAGENDLLDGVVHRVEVDVGGVVTPLRRDVGG